MARYAPAAQWRDDIPHWLDATLEKSVHPDPASRYDALSAFVEDARPRAHADRSARPRAPLLERNPLAFWRTAAFVLFALNLALIYKLSQ